MFVISEVNKTIVVIDMGHGGNDQGTQNADNGIIEKDITLEIGLKVTELLEEDSNIEILTTRTKDEYVSLSDSIEVRDREVKQDNFAVIENTVCTAIIIEI